MFNYTENEIKEFYVESAARKKYMLNLDEPHTLQEKILWLEIYDQNQELRAHCADKIGVHNYCIEKLGKDICVPILKVYNSPDEIDFKELPDKFVLKCNHGYAMNILVDKTKNQMTTLKKNNLTSEDDCKKRLDEWMNIDFGGINRQKHYALIEPKCYAEKMMEDENQKLSLFDYKFWCFNGEPKMFTINDGFGHGDIMYYDLNGNEINLYGIENSPNYKQPNHLEQMVEYAKKLSSPFKFVRVDFYEINDVVYLGEMTFTPGAGMFRYKDRDTDLYWGNQIKL